MNPAETVSYRSFLEILLLPGVWLFTQVGRTLSSLGEIFWMQVVWEVLPFTETSEDTLAAIIYWLCVLGVFFAAAFVPAYSILRGGAV